MKTISKCVLDYNCCSSTGVVCPHCRDFRDYLECDIDIAPSLVKGIELNRPCLRCGLRLGLFRNTDTTPHFRIAFREGPS
jgi:hypothetical protein